MSLDEENKWNERYRGADHVPQACDVLQQNRHLLPPQGRALDLACGLGGNALLLASLGFQVQAWDISDVAIGKIQQRAKQESLSIDAQVRNVEKHYPEPDAFDVIVVSYYLDRKLFPALIQSLRPQGLIYYETFTRAHVSARGPQNPVYRLQPNELLAAFSELQILYYREEDLAGDVAQGTRDVAQLVAMRVPGV